MENQIKSLGFRVMNNPIVMEKVAQRLPPKDLFALRPTCVLWDRQFVPQIKRRHAPIRVKLEPNASASEFVRLFHSRSLHEIPFDNFRLENIGEPLDLQGFLEACGPIVRSLAIGWEVEKKLGAEGLYQLVFGAQLSQLEHLEICASNRGRTAPFGGQPPNVDTGGELAKLRSLEFESHQEQDPDYHLVLPAVIRAATALKELKFTRFAIECPRDGFLHAVFGSLRHASNSNPSLPSPLRSLSTPRLLAAELRLLAELGASSALQLQYFSTEVCRFWSPNDDEATAAAGALHAFLATQSQTLLLLKIEGLSFVDNSRFDCRHGWLRLPRLEHLRSLVLKMDECGDLQLEGVDLEACFPKLRSLQVTDYAHDNLDVRVLSHPGLRELEGVMTRWKWGRLAPRVPMVTQAKISFLHSFGTPPQSRVWSWWPQIVELELRGDLPGPLDAFLTGVSPTRLGRLRGELETRSGRGPAPTLDTLRTLKDKWKVEAGIGNLQHLQKLTVRIYDSDEQPLQLTDIGVYFGLAMATPRLQAVTIAREKGNPVSEDAVAFLRSVLGPNAGIELSRVDPAPITPLGRAMAWIPWPFLELLSWFRS